MVTTDFKLVWAGLCLALVAAAHSAPVCMGNCSIGTSVSVGSNGAGNGSLAITGGDVVNAPNIGSIGAFGPSSGSATVSGAGSRMSIGGTSGSQLFVGAEGGTGSLTVAGGGRVTVDAFNNPAGFGDARAHIGSGGIGTVNVNAGGSLFIQDQGPFGVEDGIQLGRSTAAGGAGSGTLNIDGGSVTVRGNYGFVNVGQANTLFSGTAAGSGRLNITAGGSLLIDGTTSSGLLLIGRSGNSDGAVLVSGAGSRLDLTGRASAIYVSDDLITANADNSGRGLLRVTDNAVVTARTTVASTSLLVGYGLGSGTVMVDRGGLLDLQGSILVSANSGTHNTQNGLLLINDTGVVNATRTTVGNGNAATPNGILAGTGTLNSPVTVRAGGLISPGNSPGKLTINGDVSFAGGQLKIEVGGLTNGLFDVLDVHGKVSFASAILELAFIDGFAPKLGDSFDFLGSSSFVGLDSVSIRYTGLAPGFQFTVLPTAAGLHFTALNNAASVPEPSSLATFLLGLAVMGGLGQTRTRRDDLQAHKISLEAAPVACQ